MSSQIFAIKMGINKCYLVKDEGTSLIDAGFPNKVNAFQKSFERLPFRFRPGLPIFAEDIEKVKESWKSLVQQGAKTIYPAHGNPFSVDIMKKALTE